MARPREFDENSVLDATALCFWAKGYEATSIKDLTDATGLTTASLYNAFGDKRALYQRALSHYVEGSISDRIRRCEKLPPLEAIQTFFRDILNRSLRDRDHKGCMLVNAAIDVAPNDAEFGQDVKAALSLIEAFFLKSVEAGQKEGSITRSTAATELAHHLLGVLMGVRVLARVRPERAVLEGAIKPALISLERDDRRS